MGQGHSHTHSSECRRYPYRQYAEDKNNGLMSNEGYVATGIGAGIAIGAGIFGLNKKGFFSSQNEEPDEAKTLDKKTKPPKETSQKSDASALKRNKTEEQATEEAVDIDVNLHT